MRIWVRSSWPGWAFLSKLRDAGEVPADVVVGEDGFPRAVRVWDDSQF